MCLSMIYCHVKVESERFEDTFPSFVQLNPPQTCNIILYTMPFAIHLLIRPLFVKTSGGGWVGKESDNPEPQDQFFYEHWV